MSLTFQHAKLCKEISESATKVQNSLDKINKDSETSEGLSFLDLKNHLMVDYLIDLTFMACKKSQGKRISGDSSVDRLVEYRTYLEKLRPLESKLKYQIEKSVKVAESGSINSADPLHFKPNPKNLASKLNDDDSEDDDDDEDEEKKTGIYKVPKNVPAYFDGDKTREDLEQESKDKERKKKMSASLIEDLKRQHLDTPEEEFFMQDTMRAKQIQDHKERTRFEEDNFIRLPVTKKDKHKNRQQRFSTVASLGDELTSFGTTNYFDNDGSKNKKRRGSHIKKRRREKEI